MPAEVCLVIAVLVALPCSLLPVTQSKATRENSAERITQHPQQEACFMRYRCSLPVKPQVMQYLTARWDLSGQSESAAFNCSQANEMSLNKPVWRDLTCVAQMRCLLAKPML
jgi:hypothetical protein